MTTQQIQKEIEHYKFTGKLTSHPYLACSISGEKVMAFGPMLKKKIERHGSLENLLETFVSRKTKSIQKGPKPQKPTKKSRKKNIIEKVNEVYDIPIFQNKPHVSLFLSNHPEHTKGACWRPDIFLNNNRTCDKCHLNAFCLASSKQFSNKKTKYTNA